MTLKTKAFKEHLVVVVWVIHRARFQSGNSLYITAALRSVQCDPDICYGVSDLSVIKSLAYHRHLHSSTYILPYVCELKKKIRHRFRQGPTATFRYRRLRSIHITLK